MGKENQMSKYYGQVKGMSNTVASRRGSEASGIKASVQSYDGSVIVRMTNVGGKNMVDIEMAEGSDFSGKSFFYGTMDELKQALKKGE